MVAHYDQMLEKLAPKYAKIKKVVGEEEAAEEAEPEAEDIWENFDLI